MVTCNLCGEAVADAPAILDHLRLMHPDHYGDGPLMWPDGEPVIADETEHNDGSDDA